MPTYKRLKEIDADIQGKITDHEKLGDQYRLTVDDNLTGNKVSFMVARILAEDILANRDATFRFTGEMTCDFNTETNKTTNISFKMTGFQILDDMDLIDAVETIREMKIDLPHDFANDLIKERHDN